MTGSGIIDFHTHSFPDKVAARAMGVLTKNSGNLIPHTDGTLGGLLSLMDQDGVGRCVALNIATTPRQTAAVNNYAIATNKGRVISFGSVYPGSGDAAEELHRLKENGIKGVKFHPEYQDFFVDDDALAPLYETIRELNLITVFHAGADLGFAEPAKASAARLAAILPAFGEAPVVLAHMGGYLMWREVLELIPTGAAYFDTSFCYGRIPLPLCREIVEKHGAGHFLFGSDTPWGRPALESRLIDALELNEIDRAAIMSGNAERLLGL